MMRKNHKKKLSSSPLDHTRSNIIITKPRPKYTISKPELWDVKIVGELVVIFTSCCSASIMLVRESRKNPLYNFFRCHSYSTALNIIYFNTFFMGEFANKFNLTPVTRCAVMTASSRRTSRRLLTQWLRDWNDDDDMDVDGLDSLSHRLPGSRLW